MATNPPNPFTPDEADFLAWIEGEPLPRDREQAVARALGEDRTLARRLEAMRADRAALKSIGQVAAPAGLMAAVEAALQPVLERQMLLGLREGEPIADHPPISIVQPVKRSIMQAFFTDRVGRRLAAAAAVLLMVGGATYLGTTYLSGRTAPKPTSFTKAEPHKSTEQTLVASAADQSTQKKLVPTTELAVNPESAPEVGVPSGPAVSDAGTEVAAAEAMDYGANAMGPFMPELDGARAADLAREGRLVIRVIALDPMIAAHGGIADRVRHADQSMFRLGEEAPAAITQVLAPPAASAPQPAAEEPFHPEFAENRGFDVPAEMPGPPLPPVASNISASQTVYLVQARLDGTALDTLKSTLAGTYGEAKYEELAEPLPQDGSAALNSASVVWWTQGPSGWAWWASVPVVIDTAR